MVDDKCSIKLLVPNVFDGQLMCSRAVVCMSKDNDALPRSTDVRVVVEQ